MANKIPDELFNAMIDAVSYWLGYQFKIGREQLIHEASLRYPIADTITAKGIKINRIVLEKLHPLFKSKKIDLVIYAEHVEEPETEKDDTNLKQVFEFKLAKRKTSEEFGYEHQRVFDDVVRLAYFNMWSNKDCYFMMCGNYGDFKNYFIGQANEVTTNSDGKNNVLQSKAKENEDTEWKSTGLYKNWFGFTLGADKSIEFKIEDPNNKSEWGLRKFQANYEIREDIKKEFTRTITVRTECIAITPQGLEKTRTHAAGIWKIEGVET